MMYVTEKSHKNFFLKRVIRIIPIYWILTFGVFSIAILKPDLLNNTTADYEHLLKSLFFIPFNIFNPFSNYFNFKLIYR